MLVPQIVNVNELIPYYTVLYCVQLQLPHLSKCSGFMSLDLIMTLSWDMSFLRSS